MWFNPADLLKTKSAPPATSATSATFEEESRKVAEVADPFTKEITETAPQSRKVAKVAAPLDSRNDTRRNVIKPDDQQKLLDYMAIIGETDRALIDELLNKCASDADYLKWALDWANKLLSPNRRPKRQIVTCRSCRYFKCLNAHGGGAGRCGIGARSSDYWIWSDDPHQCDRYLTSTPETGKAAK